MPETIIDIILGNFVIYFFTISCRLELSMLAYVFVIMMMYFFWLAIYSWNLIVSSAFNSLVNSFLTYTSIRWGFLIFILVFFLWLLGIFWIASMVFIRADLILQNPHYFFIVLQMVVVSTPNFWDMRFVYFIDKMMVDGRVEAFYVDWFTIHIFLIILKKN